MRLQVLAITLLSLSVPNAARAAAPITWQWDEVTPDLFPAVDLVAAHAGSSYRLSFTVKAGHEQLLLSDGHWTITAASDFDARVDGAALVTDDARIYLATYNRTSSGCSLAAYSVGDGKQLWIVRLVAAGPVSHSKYFNRVQLRVIDGKPVIFGNEAATRYIEVRDPNTGAAVSNTPLPAQMYPYPLAESLYQEVAARLAHAATCELSGDDLFIRRAILKTADHAAKAAALGQAVAALNGVSLEHGRYQLGLELVDTKTDFRLKARRLPPRP
jgi:hypothetical protein